MSVLGGVKSGDRQADKFEKSRKSFKDEIANEVEKMSKTMRLNLLKLRKESKRIEFMTVTGQMRALNEIKVKDLKAAEDAVASNIKEAEQLESRYLKASQEEDAKNKLKIQSIKREMKKIITLIKELHVQSSVAKTASQTALRVQTLLEEKRENMSASAARLEERERKERLALESSHIRLANNLLEWQRLELQGFDENEQERVRRINKVRAKQLKEVQQKESQQLREVQRLKASSLVTMNDLDLEHLMSIEAMKADHIQRISEIDREARLGRREIKEHIKRIKNEGKAAQLKESFQTTADDLLRTQNDRAEKLRQTAERKREDTATALENEVLLKLEDLEASLENMGEYLSSDSERTGSSRSRSSADKSGSSKGAPSTLGDAEDRDLDDGPESGSRGGGADAGGGDAGKSTKSAREVVDGHVYDEDHNGQLQRAEAKLKSAQKVFAEKREQELSLQKEEAESAVATYEEKRKKLIAKNEQSLFAMMKQQSQDKLDLTKEHEREMEVAMSAIAIEKEFEGTRTRVEDIARKQSKDFRELIAGLGDAAQEVARSAPAAAGAVEKLTGMIARIAGDSSDMYATVRNVLEYTHLVQTGSSSRFAQEVRLDTLVMEIKSTLKLAAKDMGYGRVEIKSEVQKTEAVSVTMNVEDLQRVLRNLLDQMLVVSRPEEVLLKVSQQGRRIVFSLEDKKSELSMVEFKALEKAVKNTTFTMSSDNRSALGVLIAQMIAKKIDGEISLGGGAVGFEISVSVPVKSTEI